MYQYSNATCISHPKVKIKTQQTSLELCLSAVFLQDIVPVFCRATFLRRVTMETSYFHFLTFSFFSIPPHNLKFHPCQHKSTETGFVIISLCVATSDKIVHVFIFMRLFVVFAQLNTSFLL